MVLVEYSDSDSEGQNEDEVEQRQPLKKRRVEAVPAARLPPPLPASFHALYATNVRTATADDPSLHAGRSRHLPHIEGNWPTHAYLEWIPSSEDFSKLQKTINILQQQQSSDHGIYSFLKSDLGVHLPLHVSLSAPLVLKTHHKDDFCIDLTQAIAASGARAFTLETTGLAWVPNFEKNRYFLVLKLTKPANNELNKLLLACNTCAKKWKLALLYDQGGQDENSNSQPFDRSSVFHISIAWALKKPTIDDQEMAIGNASKQLAGISINFNTALLKIGNSVTEITLPE